MKVKKLAILLVVLSITIVTNSCYANADIAKIRNVTIAIMVYSKSYDAFAKWIAPYSNFHNFTLLINRENDSYSWFLENTTRMSFLTSIGEVIPITGWMQNKTEQARGNQLNLTISEWKEHLGYSPRGFFMFQPDTFSLNFLKDQGVKYVLGYCFDQYQIDWMSMRGGWQLPYYANSKNALIPENSTSGGMVVLPWLTWDWVDSFTKSHLYESETIGSPAKNDTDYVTELLENNLDACSPLGYSAFSFEFDWLYNVGVLDDAGAVLAHILANNSIQKYSAGNFTDWFKNNYPTTPTYTVNFTSPNSGEKIEWYYDTNSRIARQNGSVVSYVNYAQQNADQYLTTIAYVNFSQKVSNVNQIDTSMRFTIDALGGGQYRSPVIENSIEYSGNLSVFPQYYFRTHSSPTFNPSSAPSPSPGTTQNFPSLSFCIIVASTSATILALGTVIWLRKRKI